MNVLVHALQLHTSKNEKWLTQGHKVRGMISASQGPNLKLGLLF